jgi:uncharacterized membrane-anchored protein YitT (DUF2179 family)
MTPTRAHALLRFAADAVLIILCEALNVAAFRALIIPARLLSGGVVGTALLLNQLLALPIGLQTFVYNIPIFLLGWRFLGRRFIVMSMIGVISFSFLTDAVTLPPFTNDLLLIAVFGGILTGIADGTIFRRGGSTGGLDIIGLIANRRFGVSVGQVFMVFNAVIIALSAVFNQKPDLAMYTLIMLFVSARVVDMVVSPRPRRVALIISAQHEAVARRILQDLQRGVTYLQGSGAYTSAEFHVMMCVITRFELVELRQIIQQIDPTAFTVILDASDVIGRFDRTSLFQRLIH